MGTPNRTTSRTLTRPCDIAITGAQTVAATTLANMALNLKLTPEEIVFVAVELAAVAIVTGDIDIEQADMLLSQYFPERVASLAATQRKLMEKKQQ